MLDHRRGNMRISPASDPLSIEDTPAPSGLRLGMHHSIVMVVWGRRQSIAANGARWALNVVQSGVNRDCGCRIGMRRAILVSLGAGPH